MSTRPSANALAIALQLNFAACNNHLEDAKRFIREGADVNQQFDDDNTPLICAAKKGHRRMVKLLLDEGANPNLQRKSDGATALTLSIEFPLRDGRRITDHHSVNNLLEAGADPNIRLNNGVAPLHIAARNGDSGSLSMLLNAKANPNIQQTADGATALILACQNNYKNRGIEDTCFLNTFLLEAGANTNIKQNDGYTALMTLCENKRNTHYAEELLRYGADPTLKNISGKTALDIAREKNHTDMVNLLESYVAHGAARKVRKTKAHSRNRRRSTRRRH